VNLSALRTQVKQHGYDDISSGEVDAAINVAYLEICGAENWPFLEAGPATAFISSGPRSANLVSTLGSSGFVEGSRVLGVTYNGEELGYMDPDDYFAGPHTLPLDILAPTHYTIYAGNIYVTPSLSAGTTISVRFQKQPTDLSGDSSTPLFPSRYHQLIVYGAVAVLAGEDDDDGVQQRFTELMTKGLEQMKKDLLTKTTGRSRYYGAPGSLNFWADRLRTTGFPNITTDDAALLLQDTIADVCGRYAWPFLRVDTTITATPGQEYITLPSDCVRPLGLYLPSKGSQINYVSLADQRFDHHPSTTSGNGVPERYSIMPAAPGTSTFPFRQTRIALWPIPDQAYQFKLLYERRIFNNLANPDTPIEWPGDGLLIELGMVYRAALRDVSKESQARVALLKQEYEANIERMRNDYLIEQRDRDPVVRITQTDLWDY
jgi:hypothetical protein